MSHRLFVIDEGSALSENLSQAGDSRFTCDQTVWGAFNPESLHTCRANLIVPVAASQPDKARQLFQWLRQNPIPIPILTVLPEDPAMRK
jgi:hypothetical protein